LSESKPLPSADRARGRNRSPGKTSIRDRGIWPPVLLLAFGLALLPFLPVYIAISLVVLLCLLDGLLLAVFSGIEPEDVEMTLSVLPEGDLEATFAGSTAIARVGLKGRKRGVLRRVGVTLLVPPGVDILGPWMRRFSVRAEAKTVRTYRLRLSRVGVAVFPGVLLARRGPLGIMHRSVILFSRTRVAVLPDHERSLNPVVSRYLKPGGLTGEKVRGRAVRGGGTDFAEIRNYLPGDSEKRVDWKATARRAKLLVREYEEPREFTMRIVVDGSADMVAGPGYTRVAALVSKLGYIASREAMGLSVTAYDEGILLTRGLRGDRAAFRRLIADLVQLPRGTLISTGEERLEEGEARRELRGALGRITRAWLPGGMKESPEDTMRRLCGGRLPDARECVEALADLDPEALAEADARCPFCREIRFPDEGACSRCGRLLFAGGLAPRALCLSSILETMCRTARGREMWVLVSSFRGGEACQEVAARLLHAVSPHRQIHVVLPTIADLTNDAAEWPQSLGQYPTRDGTNRDIEVLYTAERFREFVRTIRTAGVRTHALHDDHELEEVVARVLLSEVLG